MHDLEGLNVIVNALARQMAQFPIRATGTVVSYVSETVHQVAHTFTVGQVVRHTSGAATWALASSTNAGDIHGIVTVVQTADDFIVATGGIIPYTGVAGTIYSLSATPGALTSTYTSQSNPILFAISATRAQILSPVSQSISTIADPTNGNPRGLNAVDLQVSKTGPTQVASGALSVIGGGNSNTASGQGSLVAGGEGNTASGDDSSVLGGTSNTASGTNSTAIGVGNTASGVASAVLGFNSTASGIRAIAIGNGSTAAADYSIAMGQASTTAGGTYSFAAGYTGSTGAAAIGSFVFSTSSPTSTYNATVTGSYSVGIGSRASVTHDHAMVLSSSTALTVSSSGTATLTLGFLNGIYTDGDFYRGGLRILTTRQAAIASPSGGATIDGAARAAIDSIRAALTAHGLTA